MHPSGHPPTLYEPGHLICRRGEHQPRYRITDLLGKGGMSETYSAVALSSASARSRSRAPHIAIKVLSLRQMTDWKSLDLFEREARVLAHLNHSNIPKYLDFFHLDIDAADQGQQNRHFCLVRELIPGQSLGDRVSQGWRPQEADLKDIARQVLHILDYLHTLAPPLIHRDIKPQNLICRPDGQIFLVDFGSVQEIYRHTFLGSNTFVGTAGYMPPEQFRGQVSAASDLYGLGAILLYLATRKTPDQLPQSRMKVDLAACTNFSRSFTTWLDKLLEPMEEDRFQQASTAAQALTEGRVLISPKNLKPAADIAPVVPTLSPVIRKPSDARSEVERSHQFLRLKIPLYKEESNPDHILLTPKERVGLGLLAVIAVGIGGVTLLILQVIQPHVVIFILSCLLIYGGAYWLESRSVGSYEDMLHIVFQPPVFEMIYFTQQHCSRSIWNHTKNLHVSLLRKRVEHQEPQFICVLSTRKQDYEFGQHLSYEEQEWLVAEISTFLKAIK